MYRICRLSTKLSVAPQGQITLPIAECLSCEPCLVLSWLGKGGLAHEVARHRHMLCAYVISYEGRLQLPPRCFCFQLLTFHGEHDTYLHDHTKPLLNEKGNM